MDIYLKYWLPKRIFGVYALLTLLAVGIAPAFAHAQFPAGEYAVYQENSAGKVQALGQIALARQEANSHIMQAMWHDLPGPHAMIDGAGLYLNPDPDSQADDWVIIVESAYHTTLAVYQNPIEVDVLKNPALSGKVIELTKQNGGFQDVKHVISSKAKWLPTPVVSSKWSTYYMIEETWEGTPSTPIKSTLWELDWEAPFPEAHLWRTNTSMDDMAMTGLALQINDLMIFAYGANDISAIRLHVLRREADGWAGWVYRTDKPKAARIIWEAH